MNKLPATFAAALVALCAGAFAQETDPARQQRMDQAYADSHRENVQVADSGLREDTRKAGHAIHQGLRATGHAVHTGVRATGHAIHKGVKATGHAIHEGVDKVTGK